MAYGLPLIFVSVCLCFIKILKTLLSSKGHLYYLLITGGLLAVIPLPFSLISPEPMASLLRAVVFLLGYLFSLWIIAFADDAEKYIWIKRGYFGLGVILAVYYITNFMQKTLEFGLSSVAFQRSYGGEASLPWGASNLIAGTILITLIAYLCLEVNKSKKWRMYIPMVGTAAILLTFSRTGMILMMISYLFLLRNTGFWRGFLLCTGVGIMVAVLVYWLNSTDSHVIEQLVTTRITLDNLAEASGRTELWSYLIPLIPEALVFPKGYYSSLYYFYISPHNYLLSVSLEQGIIGLIISMFFFTLLFLYFTPRKLKRPKLNPAAHSKPMFRLMWLIVLMNLFVEDLLGAQPYVFVFWGLFSLSIVEYKKIREGIHRIPYITLPRC